MKKIMAFIICTIMLFAFMPAHAEETTWLCPTCNTVNSRNFCTECGNKKPETITCANCGEQYPIDTSFKFCANCGTSLRSQTDISGILFSDEPGFDTPEDALMNYIEGLKNKDLEQVLKSFGFKTQAAHVSLLQRLDQLQTYNISLYPALPGGDPLGDAINAERARYQTTSNLTYALVHLVYPELGDKFSVHIKSKYESAEEFIEKEFDMTKLDLLNEIRDINIYTPKEVIALGYLDEKILSEASQNNFERMRIIYGADELTDRLATFRMGDKLYCCAPYLARFGDRWYVCSVSGRIANLMGVGADYIALFSTTDIKSAE